jgi:hypothetical protein
LRRKNYRIGRQRLRGVKRRQGLHALQPKPLPHPLPNRHTGCATPLTDYSTHSS